ncbi:MAG: peptide chain release factor N(5)-glutamine methyltransferase [Flavobacteriaceae bacterium]
MKSTLSSIYESDELNSIFYLISEEFLQIPRSKILLADEIELDSNKEKLFLDALDRLTSNEPVQYVIGKTTFMDLEFNVNSNVLIPRPETEELVRLMLKEDLDGKEILDIGTGSGCIAISLAKNLPNAKVSALDISEEALIVARENADLNNVDVDFINADIFDYKSQKKYDVIVSNPPYVRESEKALMKSNVVEYEPKQALFITDDNPLLYYKVILNFSKMSLNKNGKIYFEINEKHEDEIKDLSIYCGYSNADCSKDMFGKNRFFAITNL